MDADNEVFLKMARSERDLASLYRECARNAPDEKTAVACSLFARDCDQIALSFETSRFA